MSGDAGGIYMPAFSNLSTKTPKRLFADMQVSARVALEVPPVAVDT